jgi:hypothetical protein
MVQNWQLGKISGVECKRLQGFDWLGQFGFGSFKQKNSI